MIMGVQRLSCQSRRASLIVKFIIESAVFVGLGGQAQGKTMGVS